MKQTIYVTESLYHQLTISAILMNYIQLVPGLPTRLHFTDDYLIERTIADRESGGEKKVQSLVFYVDELNGEEVARTFSILSQKLAGHFEPYLPKKRYLEYDFIITQMGDGYLKDWNVQVNKRPPTD